MKPRKILEAAFVAVCAALTALAVCANLHGYHRDFSDDGLHERGTCAACDFYRWWKMGDAAFEARELRRARK